MGIQLSDLVDRNGADWDGDLVFIARGAFKIPWCTKFEINVLTTSAAMDVSRCIYRCKRQHDAPVICSVMMFIIIIFLYSISFWRITNVAPLSAQKLGLFADGGATFVIPDCVLCFVFFLLFFFSLQHKAVSSIIGLGNDCATDAVLLIG